MAEPPTATYPPPEADPDPDPDAQDRALVVRVAGGDNDALEELYHRHAGWLTVRLQRRCGEVELVDSAVQDTFIAVWRGASDFRGAGDVGAWLWGIAVRRLIDLLRKRKPTPVDPTLLAEANTATTGRFDESAEMAALAEVVRGTDVGDAMRALDPDLRSVLLVTAIDGLSTREAADLLGIPQGTVKTRLMRARAKLQERLA